MAKMVQLRHVPEDLHRKLKARAALAGLSLSDYLLQEIRRVAEQPTVAELWERIGQLPPVELGRSPADLVREERDGR
jgi:plasmid stability protein